MSFKDHYSFIDESMEEDLDHWRKNLEPGALMEYRPGKQHGGAVTDTKDPIILARFKSYKKSLPGYGYPGAPNRGSGWRSPGEPGYDRPDAKWYVNFEYLHKGRYATDANLKNEWVGHTESIEKFYPLNYETKKEMSPEAIKTFGELIDEL